MPKNPMPTIPMPTIRKSLSSRFVKTYVHQNDAARPAASDQIDFAILWRIQRRRQACREALLIDIDTGASVSLSKSSELIFNFASSSDDDIFGSYTIG
jgi:hypothetical protein